MTVVLVVQSVVIALLAALVVGLLRSHADILRALHDLGVNLDEDLGGESTAGTAGRTRARVGAAGATFEVAESSGVAHDLMGRSPEGESVGISMAGSEEPALLAFLTTGCVTCLDFWEVFASGLDLEVDGRAARIVVVTKGDEAESPKEVAKLARGGDEPLTVVMSSQAYDLYEVAAAPYFVLVAPHSGRIVGEGAARSWDQLAQLLARAGSDGSSVLARRSRTRRELLTGAARTRRVDRELSDAGVGPGHPSLQPEGLRPDPDES